MVHRNGYDPTATTAYLSDVLIYMNNQTEYKKLDLQISRCGKHCGACMFLIESLAFGDYKCLLFKEKLTSYETYEGTKVSACDDCQSVLQT